MIVVVVTGSREWQDEARLRHTLSRVHQSVGISELVQGGARGVDTMAAQWAHDAGVAMRCYPADWEAFGKSAGVIRNTKMLLASRPCVCVAFARGDSKGTAHMIKTARDASVLTLVIREEA